MVAAVYGSNPAMVSDDIEDDMIEELSPGSCGQSVSSISDLVINPSLSSQERGRIMELVSRYADVFSTVPGRTNLTEHCIRTGDARPIRVRPYPIPHAYKKQVLDELVEMERLGIIRPSKSEWASPLVIVKKSDGSLRLCVDFRALNRVSQFDAYPMPKVEDIFDHVGSSKYISTLDLTKGYWQIPLAEGSICKTAFVAPGGLYEFTVMPFGLHGAPATFQRAMDTLLCQEKDCADAYLDDLTVGSVSFSQHLVDLERGLPPIESCQSYLQA